MNLRTAIVELYRKATAALRPVSSTRGGWQTIIREPYTGAWQQNQEIKGETAVSYAPVFACVTLISADIAKLALRLMRIDDEGIWHETTNPAYSPVLRKPNRYQTTQKFVEQWITSKLVHGNTYVLKQRDARGVVNGLYVLDPTKVVPLVAPDGSVYYELRRNDLAGLGSDLIPIETEPIRVPASEIIHDLMVAIFHPLIGSSPLFACGLSALQGLTIQEVSNTFFAKGARPGSLIVAPGNISTAQAMQIKTDWEAAYSGPNMGRVAVIGNDVKYTALSVNAVDAQLIEQLRWTAETVCACYHVPVFMVPGVGAPTPAASSEAMQQQYYSQCLQSLITAFETSLDEGLGLELSGFGTEFDIDDLIYMDTATKTKAASDAIGSGAISPNEARRKYFGLGGVKGGDTPYMQQQNYSLAALDDRDKQSPLVVDTTPPPAPTAPPAELEPPGDDAVAGELESKRAAPWAAAAIALLKKDWSGVCDGL